MNIRGTETISEPSKGGSPVRNPPDEHLSGSNIQSGEGHLPKKNLKNQSLQVE